ncbi:MAG: ATP synthase F1 subunit gamma [Bacteroidales bacterium]|nr:ATP synthase F1 subunit gamma [Bacteroidales bacterium]
MPTLKEIKGRIASVRGTLKITSAMKLVSSAKLRKAQKATEAMRPYEAKLQEMLAAVGLTASDERVAPEGWAAEGRTTSPAAIVAIASNSSLCGGFNANAVAKVRSVRQGGDVVYSIGRKMAEVMRRDGFPSPEDFSALSENPAYAPAAALVEKLQQDLAEGRISRVLMVYNHFVSTARQVPVVEELLASAGPAMQARADAEEASDAIFEPSRKDLLEALESKLLKLKLYAALLDSAAAEHAARTVAMQTATDNGEKLLQELTLQYNKGRQQKITSEILDLAGGQAAQ